MRTLLSVMVLLLFSSLVVPDPAFALGGDTYIRFEKSNGAFTLFTSGKTAPLCVSSKDYPGVVSILNSFQADLAAVTDIKPGIFVDKLPSSKDIVIIGTLGKCELVDRLVREGKIDASGVAGAWEAFLIQTVQRPFPGVDQALVIAGSDKRGTIYGMFDVSEKIGVSPWYWWADVSIPHHENLFVVPGRHTDGPPSVKYRGIFLNDEYPALTKWVQAKYGELVLTKNYPAEVRTANYGHEFYERIFEVLLRLKANYLWPAMWNNAFNEDDTLNAKLADEYGIVMGTSHQEPMLRAQKEWDRRYKTTLGSWNYATHPDTLERFWREGVRRNKGLESIITIGLRGADDTPMAPGGPEENRALLEKIVSVQRKILAEEVNPDVTKVPQLWCLYKEVVDFYKAGMRVPNDVTLLWPDDNWGNNRRLPTAEERKRSGGAGIYYHFDYHGGPRSYQWINTDPLAKIWEQMSLAKEYGADRIWIVNVGHFKGYELPLEYFMNLAWDSHRWTNANIGEFTKLWAEREFGPTHAEEIAGIMSGYTRITGRCKPELLSPVTYSLVNYQEAESVVAGLRNMTERAEKISETLPPNRKDSFYELVLFPAKASAILNGLYFAAGKNALYAKQGRAETNAMARETRALFSADTALMGQFNRDLAGGKWDHFMDQAHLGYTGWADPPENSLRAVPLVEISVPEAGSMGVAVEGSESSWPEAGVDPWLPVFDPFASQRHFIEIFNKGKASFDYAAKADKPWIIVSAPAGNVTAQTRLWISIDWKKAPRGHDSGTVKIEGTGKSVAVNVRTSIPAGIIGEPLQGFIEGAGYVSMEAEHYTNSTESGTYRWIRIEEYGATLSGMRTVSAVDAPAAVPGTNAPCLEYRMYILDTGKVDVEGRFGPALNFMPDRGVRYGVSFDDDPPQVITLVPQNYSAQNGNREWEQTVIRNGRLSRTTHTLKNAGYHTLKVWMVDPGVVLEKIVVNLGRARPSYLGPPESFHGRVMNK